MQSIHIQIEQLVIRNGRGKLIFPADFQHIGTVENVKKVLLRLEQRNTLVRIAHGIYLYPKQDKELGILYPSVEEIAKAIAKRDKARIIPTGVQALNKLGLSTQVPLKVVFLTDGAPRTVQIGKRTIKFKKTTPKNLLVKGEITGLIIQALREIGKENVTNEQLDKLKNLLKKESKTILEHDARLAPSWIAKIILLESHKNQQ
jgi:hypothetical protein